MGRGGADCLRLQARALHDGGTSAEELLRGQLAAVRRCEGRINALAHRQGGAAELDEEALLAAARQSDARRSEGRALSALDGIAFGVKDNIDVAGMDTGAGLGTPPARAGRDAPVVAALRAAGMIPLAKLNMDEAALGASNDNPHLGRCHNPLRPGHTPGGSSGGSAALVASGMAAAALGTDTMGSVRIPAAYCGLCAIKPSGQSLRQEGVVPVSSRLDTVGPLAHCPADLALLLRALGGQKPELSPEGAGEEGVGEEGPDEEGMDKEGVGGQGLPLGWLQLDGAGQEPLQPQVADAMQQAYLRLEAAGHDLRPVSAQGLDFGAIRRAGLVLGELEMLRVHGRALEAHPQGFSPQLRAMLDWARKQPPETEQRAAGLLDRAAAQVGKLLQGCRALLLPTAPQPAFAFGAPAPANQADFTALFSVSGHPAVSIPAPVPQGEMPVGLQLVGGAGQDFALLALAGHIHACLQED